MFCIDSIETKLDNTFTEVTQLEHSYNSTTNRLTIRNDGSINFVSLGIAVDSVFIIQQVDVNTGTYRVFSVNTNSIELTRLIGVVSGSGNGNRLTKYTYTLDCWSFVPFTNYTNQGFTETENLGVQIITATEDIQLKVTFITIGSLIWLLLTYIGKQSIKKHLV